MFSLFVVWIYNNKHRKAFENLYMFERAGALWLGLFLVPQWHSLEQSLLLVLLFWWSTLLCNSKPEMNAKRHEFRENINTKENNDKWHKLLSKRTYLVCYYLRCHSTWIGLTEWSRSEKVVNMLKSTSPTVDGSLDSSIFGCYARVTPRATSHMRNALALLWATN